MSQEVTIEGLKPAPLFNSDVWYEARIEESATSAITSAFTQIDVIVLNPVDSDPTDPLVRDLTTNQASDTPDLWYRVIFATVTGDTMHPTVPIQNSAAATPYATAEELAAILNLTPQLETRRPALNRVLAAAAAEIDDELGRSEPFISPPAKVVEVNLERAVEHWKQMESPFGVIGLGGMETPAFTSVDTWNRHAAKLSPGLKESWGIA